MSPANQPPRPVSAARQGGVRAFLWRWFRRLTLTAVACMLLGAIGVVLVVRHYESDLPSVEDLQRDYRPPQVTRVLARDGSLLAELFTERRTVVRIDQLPAHVKLAVLAAEDAHFYEHEGLNYFGMLRALVENLRSGKTRQGGSTITQQVVKNLLLDPERTYRRKIREVILARRLEQNLSKDRILELYLNHIYWGHGRYGIEEASLFYFGCHASELSLAQAALLAGLVASPENASPRRNPERASVRRRFVLDQMREKGFITAGQHDTAVASPIVLASAASDASQVAPEVVEIVKRTLQKVAGEGALLGGYTVTTTIDPVLQKAAREAVRNNLAAFDARHGLRGPLVPPKGSKKGKRSTEAFEGTPKFSEHKVLVGEVTGADDAAGVLLVRVGTVQGTVRMADHERYNPKKLPPSQFASPGTLVRVSLLAPEPQNPSAPDAARVPLRLELGPEAALVAIDVRSRDVLALVGNFEGIPGALDRATHARRQPGSTFKPIVYSYALHTRRYTPATLVETRPGSVRGYNPSNYEDTDGTAPMRLREALANSVNVAAVHVAQDVGVAAIVPWAQALGIQSKMGADLSLALGAYEVTPVEMANVYATFASGGIADSPRVITRIVDASGKELSLPSQPPPRRVMEEGEAYLVTSLLQSVVDHGTGTKAKKLGRPVAGKTGTSNDAKDAWFVGYSTDIACATWTGYDDSKPLGAREAGSTAALPAWVEFMAVATRGKPPTEFPRPSDIVVVRIDPATGLLAREGQEDGMDEVFLKGTEPTEIAPEDAGVADAADEDAGAQMRDAPEVPSLERDAETLPALPPPEDTVPLF